MESVAALRSFQCITSPLKSAYENPGAVPGNNAYSGFGKFSVQGLGYSWRLSSQNKFERLTLSCLKTSEATIAGKSDDLGNSNGAVMSDSCQNGSVEKKPLRRAAFPNGFKELIAEVCDETEIAELKLKVGDFEMHMKRNIKANIPPPPVESPVVAPPIPSEPMSTSTALVAPPPPAKPSSEKVSPFINIPAEKTAKLAILEASGATGYVIVSSPTVGLFQRGRTLKGNKQPPVVNEGDVIREGQTIGFLNQFGTELPVKSDVAGEVLKILYNDGEAIGYGDPLMAVLPSFHGIE